MPKCCILFVIIAQKSVIISISFLALCRSRRASVCVFRLFFSVVLIRFASVSIDFLPGCRCLALSFQWDTLSLSFLALNLNADPSCNRRQEENGFAPMFPSSLFFVLPLPQKGWPYDNSGAVSQPGSNGKRGRGSGKGR